MFKLFKIDLFLILMRFGIFSSVIHGEFKRSLDFRQFNAYRVRFARLQDLPFIRNCNLENLPENYSDNFYYQQIRNWPKLSLLCEDDQDNVVAYALGRILHNHQAGNPLISSIKTNDDKLQQQQHKVKEDYGHVLSVAVNKNHRGQSIAKEMMDFMHMQFASNYDINSIDLYCRESNKAAIKLYKSFGYEITSHEKNYYKDGEDAYRMELLDFVSHYAYIGEDDNHDDNSSSHIKNNSKNDVNNAKGSVVVTNNHHNRIPVTAMSGVSGVSAMSVSKRNIVSIGNSKTASLVIDDDSNTDNRSLYDRVFNMNKNNHNNRPATTTTAASTTATTIKTNVDGKNTAAIAATAAATAGGGVVMMSGTGSVFPTSPSSTKSSSITSVTATNAKVINSSISATANLMTSLWSLPHFNNNSNSNNDSNNRNNGKGSTSNQ